MKTLVPTVQTYYDQISDIDFVSTQYLNNKSALSELSNKLDHITNDIKHITLMINDALLFSFTPRRRCKIVDYRTTGQSILFCVSKITSQFSELVKASTAAYDGDNLNDIIANLFPSTETTMKIENLFQILTSVPDDNRCSHEFLLTQHNFFYSVANYCSTISNILNANPLCSDCVITTIPNIGPLYVLSDAARREVCRIETLHAQNCTQTLALLIKSRQQMPLLTVDGKRIAIIPNDQSHTQFIENNEGFVFATTITSWDPTTMSRIIKRTFSTLEIDSLTKRITAPEQFKGFPQPEFLYVSFKDLYERAASHLDESCRIIDHINSKFINAKMRSPKIT
jgi:hypothetical protein